MHTLEKLRDMLMDELKQCAERDNLTNSSLDTVDKLTHAVKSIDTIMAMEEAGYSNDNYSYAPGRRGYVRRDSMGRYSNGNGSYDGGTYRRGNNYRGYDRNNMGYSREDAKTNLIEQLRDMSMGADGEQKMMLDEWIAQVEQR